MNLKILKKADFTTTKWSGGDTTQLYIYPEDGSYTERNFLFRLSSATVTDEKSTFTKLDGVSRKLMVLAGEMKLEHLGRYSKVLREFEQDSFMGDWDTASYGKVIDFNLMTKEGCIGMLENIKVASDSKVTLEFTGNKLSNVIISLYPVRNSMKLLFGEEEIVVEEKNLLLIEQAKPGEGSTITISNENKEGILNVVMAEVVFG
ncbi:HutD family protein [Clostridium sp. YIM B02515]|uniref:HutD family protein n=1 Tax=Clostridium rhizosphaerae TaxID=2803861 RepID=A0ABS1T6R9_9CLOT|nr:HutD family protein [Clostridium rhizosphaerae]MBL4935043.1 HutD family protein [Clostridium rhizosphaerae]